jgi:predicted RNase H-like nuclease (RuvC/YqgF family)
LVAAEGKIEQLESKISALEKQKSTLEEEKIRENLAHTNDTARMKRAHDEEKKQVQMGNYSQAAQIHIQSKDEEIEELTKDIKNMQNAAVQYQQEWIAKTQAWASSVTGDGAAGKPLLAVLLAVALAVVIVIFIVVLIATRREGATR